MMFSFGNSLDDLAKIKMEQAMDKNVSSKLGRQRPLHPQKKTDNRALAKGTRRY